MEVRPWDSTDSAPREGGDNLANFIPKMGPRANKGGGSEREGPAAEKERPRGVDRSVHAGIRRRSPAHSHA